MPDWMIWTALIWMFFAVRGRHGCSRTGPRHRVGPAARPVPIAPARSGVGGSRPGGASRAPMRPETAEERLQRQFVEGRLTIEEYEDALWREIRGRRR